jgi:hypothetical protein
VERPRERGAPAYRALPVEEVGRVWAAMFLPNADEAIASRAAEPVT